MGRIYRDFTELVGNTPLVELARIAEKYDLSSRILAKIEYLNPAGSVKDRTAWGIIREAEKNGKLKPGDLLFDLTSGNTGIGFAAVAAARGYRTKFYLRNTISEDKINILRQFGSEIELIENEELFQPDAIHRIIDRIKGENPDAFYTGQRSNDANPQVHFETTGPEIWRDTDGNIDILVATVGTGGTVSGAGRFLKSQNPEIKIVVAEPTPESVPSPDNPGAPTIEGVHKVTEVEESTLPETYNKGVVDEVVAVTTEQARRAALAVAREEGLLVGTSSGAAIAVAIELSRRVENRGKTIAVVFPDSGERYLSLFDALD
ncbi:PLP-dependent cysteine synthase family protein [Agrobacterium tumefaciens]|uniref:PLP-dependent cysteine synthase family protein n=1 Tax=Agrobacterium tumefaciens TaxID=358 RepID=UPI00045B1B26|nr:cysteine synthase family protein [Agrobacterium tumefaciens]UXS34142.1 cysteine synthase family protein [Agrobacterium tumefaciens]CDN95611.1 Cysteine synthase [Agrobacterium tumefaciens]